MSDIAAPIVADSHPDRHLHCQDELQVEFRAFIDRATEAGWSEREVLLAIADLADNQLLALEANDNTDVLIALLKRMT